MPNNNKKHNNNKTKSNRKGSRFYNGNHHRDNTTPKSFSDIKLEKETPATQDPYWYAKDDATINQFASLPFVEVVGSDIGEAGYSATPTLMAIPFTPTIPGSESSGINSYATRAANAYYQSVAQGFSTNFDFEAPDMLMTAICAADLFAFLAEGARAFGLTNYFLQNNKGWPDTVIRGLGFNPRSLRENKKQFVAEYNLRADSINKLIALPKKFFIMNRWMHISSNLFTENGTNGYSVCYAYTHRAALKYNGTAHPNGTAITYRYTETSNMTMETFFSIVDELLEALTGDDPRQIFSAIRRVYADSELATMNHITSDFTTELDRGEVQSVQLHNATFLPADTFLAADYNKERMGFACSQDVNGNIITRYAARFDEFEGAISTDLFNDENTYLISMSGLDRTPGNVLDITANILPVDYDDPDDAVEWGIRIAGIGKIHQPIYPRSEVLHLPVLYSPLDKVNDTIIRAKWYYPAATDTFSQLARDLPVTTRMYRAPFVKLFNEEYYSVVQDGENVVSGIATISDVIGEIDEYTVVNRQYLKNLHCKCAYNMLLLPESSKSVTK